MLQIVDFVQSENPLSTNLKMDTLPLGLRVYTRTTLQVNLLRKCGWQCPLLWHAVCKDSSDFEESD